MTFRTIKRLEDAVSFASDHLHGLSCTGCHAWAAAHGLSHMGCRARAQLHGLLHMGGRTWDVAHAVSG